MNKQLRIYIPGEQFLHLLISFTQRGTEPERTEPIQQVSCKSAEDFIIKLEKMMWYNNRKSE